MVTSIPARLALAAGFLSATLAYGAWTTTRTALDPDATSEVAEELLNSAPVQENLVAELQKQVTEAVESQTVDPEVARALTGALEDPRLVAAFTAAVTDLHRSLLEGRTGEITLDVTEVTDAVRDAVASVDPALAAEIDDAEPIRLDLGDTEIPAISTADDRARQIVVIATLCALVLLALGVALHPSQRDALARIGRRIAYLAIGPAIAFLLLPWILSMPENDGANIAGSVLKAYGGRVLPSAAVLALCGIAMWITVRLWPKATPAEKTKAWSTAAPPNPYATTADARPTEQLYM